MKNFNSSVGFALILALCASSALSASANPKESFARESFAEAFELYKTGNLAEAKAKFEGGLIAQPKNAMALFFLGEVNRDLGNIKTARSNYEASLLADPKSRVAEQAKARLADPAAKTSPQSVATQSANIAPIGRSSNSRYTISDGEVYDKKTGLVWQRCSVGQKWQEGSGCVGIIKGFTNSTKASAESYPWRIPSQDELRTLLDHSRDRWPAIDIETFPDMSINYSDYHSNDGSSSGVSFDPKSYRYRSNSIYVPDGAAIRLVRENDSIVKEKTTILQQIQSDLIGNWTREKFNFPPESHKSGLCEHQDFNAGDSLRITHIDTEHIKLERTLYLERKVIKDRGRDNYCEFDDRRSFWASYIGNGKLKISRDENGQTIAYGKMVFSCKGGDCDSFDIEDGDAKLVKQNNRFINWADSDAPAYVKGN